jgi:hypothetical protein
MLALREDLEEGSRLMNIADQDQYAASMRDFAENLRVSYLAFRRVGFSHRDAMRLLVGSFAQNAGIVQAQAIDRMVSEMKEPNED